MGRRTARNLAMTNREMAKIKNVIADQNVIPFNFTFLKRNHTVDCMTYRDNSIFESLWHLFLEEARLVASCAALIFHN